MGISKTFKKILGLETVKTGTNIQEKDIQLWHYSKFDKSIYEMDTIRACVDAIARNISKMELNHIRLNENGSRTILRKSNVARILKRPNSYMTMRDFIYKCATIYFIKNNCFIYPEFDNNGQLIGLYPINHESYKIVEKDNIIFIKFQIKYTLEYVVPFENIICLKRFFYSNEFTGEDNNAILSSVELINSQNQGVINAIKNSAIIRGILKVVGVIKEEDLEKKKKEFMTNNLSTANNNGVIILDNKFNYQTIEQKPYMVNPEMFNHAKQKILDYFGVNDDFIQNKFNSDKYDAIYEGTLEPFAVMFAQALSNGIFSEKELGFGNEIEVSMNRIKYQPFNSIVSLIQTTQQVGMFTKDEFRNMLGYAPLEEGQEVLISLNYVKDNGKKGEEDEKE